MRFTTFVCPNNLDVLVNPPADRSKSKSTVECDHKTHRTDDSGSRTRTLQWLLLSSCGGKPDIFIVGEQKLVGPSLSATTAIATDYMFLVRVPHRTSVVFSSTYFLVSENDRVFGRISYQNALQWLDPLTKGGRLQRSTKAARLKRGKPLKFL